MKEKFLLIFVIFLLILICFSRFCYATETGNITTEDENVESTDDKIEENSINFDVIHQDLGAIFSILVFFAVVILLYFVYKFFNMFFTF